MKAPLLLAVCAGCLFLMADGDLANFAEMIRTVARCSSLDYPGYACHCGWGGNGRPMDATDWCCWAHDCCYAKVSRKCDPMQDSYSIKVYNRQVICGGDWCGRMACECDKAAALCFKKNRKTYTWRYAAYPNFFCTGNKPPC